MIKKLTKIPLFFFCGVLFISPQSAVLAKTPDDDSEEEKFETVVVMAQKRAQSAQEVGINMSVINTEEIAIRKLETVTDVVSFSPNVAVKENFPGMMPIITIRGVGLNDFNATNNPATGVYIDGVSLSSLALLNTDFFDVERIEVLRGPQGTLYGRNSTAGAINISTIKPVTDAMFSKVSGTYGNYENREIEGLINIPVGQDSAFRLSAKGVWQDEGFWFNELLNKDIGRRDVTNARGQWLWEAGDSFELNLKLEVNRTRSELGGTEFFGLLPQTETQQNCPGAPNCSNFFGYFDPNRNPFVGSWSTNPEYNFDQFNTTLSLRWDIGDVSITSITGLIDFDRSYSTDVDASPLRLTDFNNSDDVQQISQELQIASSSDSKSWIAGLFYANDEVLTRYRGELQDLFNTTTFTEADQETSSYAGFANIEWHIAKNWDLITGLRYTKEKRKNVGLTQDLVSEQGGSLLTGAPFSTPPLPLASIEDSIEDSNWSWKLGLNWQRNRNSLIYASVSKGTKSGGFFSGVATSSAQLQPYLPESLISYEIGTKNVWHKAGLSFEGSLFYYDYSNVQTFIRDIDNNLPIQRLGNVSEAEIYGADANLVFKPAAFDGLDFTAGIGLLRTKLGAFNSSVGLLPEGNKQPDAPARTYHLGTSYEYEFSSGYYLRFGVDSRFQSEAFRDALNDPLLKSDEYWVINSQISLIAKDWRFTLWGKNLTDKRYVTQGLNQLVFGNGYRVYGAPRTFGISVSFDFE